MAGTTQGIGLKTYDITTDNGRSFVTGTSENMVAIDTAITDKVKVNNIPSNVNFIGSSDGVIEGITSNNLTYSLKKKSPSKSWKKFDLPITFGYSPKLSIYTDGNGNYKTDFDSENYKNTGGTTIYCSPNGLATNAGTLASPYTLKKAYDVAVNGDTIIMLEGHYDRSNSVWASTIIQKSINIIGQGEVVVLAGQRMVFEKEVGYTNVYKCNRSFTNSVIDYKSIKNNYIVYKKLNSIAEVEATECSWYIDASNNVYVHGLNGLNPSDTVFCALQTESYFDINNNLGNTKVYIENVKIVGKFYGVSVEKTVYESELFAIFNNVHFLNQNRIASNGFWAKGCDVLLYKCVASNNAKDGFNYVGIDSTHKCNFIEIDCVGANNGIGNADGEYQNGSTSHENCRGIRINGLYYNNFGANVADVQTTQTVNIKCYAYNSCATTLSQGFSTQQAVAEMWLYDCVSFDNDYDVYNVSNSTMHINSCAYETKMLNGTNDEVNKKSLLYVLLQNTLQIKE